MGVAVGNRNYFSVNKHTYRKDGGVRARVHIAGNEYDRAQLAAESPKERQGRLQGSHLC